jgi:hypothetical protein
VDDLEVEDDTKVDELGALNLHLLQLEDENQEDETLMVGKNNQTLLKNKETGLNLNFGGLNFLIHPPAGTSFGKGRNL